MDWLARAAAARPDHEAVVAEDARLTYAALDFQATELAGRLAGRGAHPGARVAVALPSSARHVALLHALARARAVAVPLDPRLGAEELARRARSVDASLAVAEGAPAEALEAAGVRTASLEALARSPPGAFFPGPWEGLQGLVSTSGTSGRARAVRLSFANHAASAAAVAFHLGVREDDRWLACVPLFHVGGLAVVWRSALWATTVVLQGRFEPQAVRRALDHERVTLASMVPVMLQRVVEGRSGPFPARLRAVVLGGDAASEELLAACKLQGVRVLPSYGLTEAASTVACAPLNGPAPPPGCAGLPLPTASVAILDDRGEPVARGSPGEVAVSGPMVTEGYEADPETNAKALRDGWLRTGDLGFLDKDGALWVLGRLDDRIRTGGESVDPATAEAALRAHPGVEEACVVGLPDQVWGQRVAAAVVLRAGSMVRPGDLEAHCRKLLAGFEVPRVWGIVAALPRNEAGKVVRAKVRAGFGVQPER